jgi:valyl-tRNA synthetase
MELTKPALSGEAERPFVREVLLEVLEESLRLLHPVMPFLTEELWQRLPGVTDPHGETIVLAPYPDGTGSRQNPRLERHMGALFEVVGGVRKLRAELVVAPKERLALQLAADDGELVAWLVDQSRLLEFLAGLDAVTVGEPPVEAARDRVGGVLLGISAAGRDLGGEQRQRLEKEAVELRQVIGRARGQLSNRQFVDRAPAEVVEAKRESLRELEERLAAIEAGL